ncbi:hypothetical protein FBULB1_5928 [Fusarium bulbicola]|nr:hypothetical protein FBULB1_5928 [Fusarium bulbicola]
MRRSLKRTQTRVVRTCKLSDIVNNYEIISNLIEDELFTAFFENSKSKFCSFFDLRLFDELPEQDLVNVKEPFVEGHLDEITRSSA